MPHPTAIIRSQILDHLFCSYFVVVIVTICTAGFLQTDL